MTVLPSAAPQPTLLSPPAAARGASLAPISLYPHVDLYPCQYIEKYASHLVDQSLYHLSYIRYITMETILHRALSLY